MSVDVLESDALAQHDDLDPVEQLTDLLRGPVSRFVLGSHPDLRGFLDSLGVATFKVPEQVVIWDALPKNDAGKVLKHQIRATLT